MKIYIEKKATGNLQNHKVDQKLNIEIQKKTNLQIQIETL